MVIRSFIIGMCTIACAFWVAHARAFSLDTAMVTQVQGTVSLTNNKEQGKPIVAFTKVKNGDKLSLGQNVRIQLVYFDGGRQETWQNNGQIEIGNRESQSTNLKPEVRQLPPILVRQLVRTPSADVKNRAGMIVMRAVMASDKLKELEDNYANLRAQSDPTDIMPDLYLLSGLFELKELERVKSVLANLQTKFPDRKDVKDTVQHYNRLIAITAE